MANKSNVLAPVLNVLEATGNNVVLFLRAVRYLPSLPLQLGRTIDYAFQFGYKTFPIVGILCFFLGAVLALQIGASVDFSGGTSLIGPIVGIAIAREIGPLIAAFLLAGRVGSAITAEIASMKVYQEIDALRTMQIAPERLLIMPRLVAIFFMMPILAVGAIVIGWYGGAVISSHIGFIDLSPAIYWDDLRSAVDVRDVIDGLIKTQIFGIVVVLICCERGMATTGGPREIGNSVTKAVVTSMCVVLLLDYVITRLLLQTN